MIHSLPQSLIDTAANMLQCHLYLNEDTDRQTTLSSLKDAFDTALSQHLSYPAGSSERRASSRNARAVVESHIGIDEKTGQTRSLLGQNQKLMKAGKTSKESGGNPVTLDDGSGVETTGLSLSPAHESGKFKLCPNSKSCKTSCLGKTSGGYFQFGGGKDLNVYKGPRLNGLNRTHALIKNPGEFAVRLHDEIQAAKYTSELNGNKLGVRLNVLSDIHPKVFKSLMDAHPDVQFYDYTKNNSDPIAPNHHLTYSSTGVSQPAGLNGLREGVDNPHQNWHQMRNRLESGHNVAMVFSNNKTLPRAVHCQESGNSYHVISGDDHDYRPLDGKDSNGNGLIVGLKRKAATMSDASAAKDSSGFIVHYDPMYEREGKVQKKDEYGNSIPTNHVVHIAKQSKKMIVLDNDSNKVKADAKELS